jgi:hypothetical protein
MEPLGRANHGRVEGPNLGILPVSSLIVLRIQRLCSVFNPFKAGRIPIKLTTRGQAVSRTLQVVDNFFTTAGGYFGEKRATGAAPVETETDNWKLTTENWF